MSMEMEVIKVRIRFIEPLLGTIPKDPKLYDEWVKSKKEERIYSEAIPKDVNDAVRYDDETATVEQIEAKGWTGFHNTRIASAYGEIPEDELDNGIFVFDYMMKGFLKNAANVLKYALGMKNTRSKIDNLVFVFPRRLYLGKNEPDGVLERPIRVMTMQGPRVALIRSDYVKAGNILDFTLTIVPNKDNIDMEVMRQLFSYGRLCGLGQFRTGGYGRFEVLSMERIS